MKTSICMMLTCLALITCACASKTQSPNPKTSIINAKTSILKTGPEYPPWDGPVKVYSEKPDIEYEELGAILVVDPNKTPQADLVALQQKLAASIGGNAIIIRPDTSITIGNVPAGKSSEKTVHHLMATAIRINPDDWTPPDESDSRIEMTPWPASGHDY